MTAHSSGAAAGSSPHTRGAQHVQQPAHSGTGIIPAYAGSTPSNSADSRWPRDHPRIRGEHAAALREIFSRHGSSPHTRGALAVQIGVDLLERIIPAYAGSTGSNPPQLHWRQDHPRIRGEHVQMNRAIADGSGSSPHTRGAPRHLHLRRQARRIIPAYAGSTPAEARRWRPLADHPRIRGEHSTKRDFII